jgi:hypothetical protein
LPCGGSQAINIQRHGEYIEWRRPARHGLGKI